MVSQPKHVFVEDGNAHTTLSPSNIMKGFDTYQGIAIAWGTTGCYRYRRTSGSFPTSLFFPTFCHQHPPSKLCSKSWTSPDMCLKLFFMRCETWDFGGYPFFQPVKHHFMIGSPQVCECSTLVFFCPLLVKFRHVRNAAHQAVRATHIPTGFSVQCTSSQSQFVSLLEAFGFDYLDVPGS